MITVYNIARNPKKHDRYQRGLVSMVYKLSDKKTPDKTVKYENISNKELFEELHKLVIRYLYKTLLDNHIR